MASAHQEATLADFAVIGLCGPCAVRARQRIVERYLPLVYTQSGRVARFYQVDVSDVVQAGVLGLYRAIDRYDPTRGEATFMGFATFFVRTWCHHEARRAYNVASRSPGQCWEAAYPVDLVDRTEPGTPPDVEARVDARVVYDAIQAVPGTQGLAVRRVLIEDRDVVEVGRELGVTKQRAHQLLLEGEAAVRDSLAPRRVA